MTDIPDRDYSDIIFATIRQHENGLTLAKGMAVTNIIDLYLPLKKVDLLSLPQAENCRDHPRHILIAGLIAFVDGTFRTTL
ncbi:MAG: hypothetical protein PHR78_07990 [Eubacteriales bacterium]|nr:hypothetical protein [Eubacteriales bacterium]